MRRMSALSLLLALGGCAAPYADTALLCERDAACSAHPFPKGQNGVAWSPQGHNRGWSPGGADPTP
jgi:hypothetical protein